MGDNAPLFQLCSFITTCNYRKVICTAGFRRRSLILGTRRSSNVIVLQSVVNKATFEVPYNALMVTKTQPSTSK